MSDTKVNYDDLLTQAIVKLYDEERFYAELLIQMDRKFSDKIPTLGVRIMNTIELVVNPKFFAAMPLKEQVAVLKHECQHILNDHIPRSKEIAPEIYDNSAKDMVDQLINGAKHQLINVAADCAINEGIQNLPKEACYPATFKMKSGETLEYYVNELRNNKDIQKVIAIDDHSIWAESEGDKDEIKEKIKKVVNKAAAEAKAVGKLSGEQELLIDKMNYKPRDWRSDLRRFVARSVEIKLESSKKKRNRRYGIMHPGTVKEELLNIGVAIDTSGSISDEALCQFMTEISSIAKYATVTVVEADTQVQNSYVFDPKKTYKVKGRGGTAYQPALDYFTNETEVDGVIYLGDMDNYDSEKLIKPKYPVLWAVLGNQSPPADWGSITKVEVKNK